MEQAGLHTLGDYGFLRAVRTNLSGDRRLVPCSSANDIASRNSTNTKITNSRLPLPINVNVNVVK